jgi:hypothetical protein
MEQPFSAAAAPFLGRMVFDCGNVPPAAGISARRGGGDWPMAHCLAR